MLTRTETYLPDDREAVELSAFDDYLGSRTAPRGAAPKFYLVSDSGDRVEVPAEIFAIVRQVANAMRRGLAVTIAPQDKTLTTQQAADLLNVSRPTVIKLLDRGDLPHTKAGSHRRIALGDLLEYRERRREEQYEAIEALAVPLEDEDSVDAALQRARRARKAAGSASPVSRAPAFGI